MISRHIGPPNRGRGGCGGAPPGTSAAASGRDLSVMRPACPAAPPGAMGRGGGRWWGFPHPVPVRRRPLARGGPAGRIPGRPGGGGRAVSWQDDGRRVRPE
ncbi:hypothetical protein Stsp01_41490 [Streptomyces sp. NBRC 13847]|nr:hypothetical protein Stsp01_41490 [Streptomyces sp. NBRC 13847]